VGAAVTSQPGLDEPDEAGRPWTVDTSTPQPPSGVRAVIVPPVRPVLSPAAARALLRLLVNVYAKRSAQAEPSKGTNDHREHRR